MKPETQQKMFHAPMPGQSLTAEPKSRPWERPPQFVDPDDAFIYIMDRMAKPKNTTQLLTMLDRGLTVNAVVDNILQSGVMNGKWSVDLGVILAEPTAALVMRLARDAGVKYKTRPDQTNYDLMKYAGQKQSLPSPSPEVQQNIRSAAEMPNAPQGIMARRGK